MLREAIMKRSKLKNKANKTKLPVDINNYKKQRNCVVNLDKSAKFGYFNRTSKSLPSIGKIFPIRHLIKPCLQDSRDYVMCYVENRK